MKKIALISLISIGVTCMKAQEKYGNTLNLGLGLGYGAAEGSPLALVLNYEFDVAKNFTLAPFVSFYTYASYYYWGNPNYPYMNYDYRTTVVPVGVKGCYYFDDLLKAGDKWDFYLGLSLGFAFRSTNWENNYAGPAPVNTTSGLYLDGHIGARYHIKEKIGVFLDLSTGISSLGVSFKVK